MPVEFCKDFLSRQYLKNNPDKNFIFGDNLLGKGLGGQAKEMRGECNAFGVPTKKYPSMKVGSFFTDSEFESNAKYIDEAIAKIPRDKTIVIPESIGTGLAQLDVKAPKTYDYLMKKLQMLGK